MRACPCLPHPLDAVLLEDDGVQQLRVALVLVLHKVVQGVHKLHHQQVVVGPGEQELGLGEELQGAKKGRWEGGREGVCGQDTTN